MKVPFKWLQEFVPHRLKVEELAKRLTDLGFEVEEIIDVAGDKVLEVAVTANRGDCLSVRGLGRELAANLGIKFKDIKINLPRASGNMRESVSVSLRDSRRSPRYSLRVIHGVKIGPSPDWLTRRLEQVGIRSINSVVDITNYVLMEMGQPLHAFDLAKIRGGKVLIRAAANGEKILTLDGEDRKLDADDLVIADAEGPVALAGVMGGKDSEVDESTKAIALESAFFDPATVRKTAKRLGAQTESSYRFERRVDPEGIIPALNRATELICSLAGGTATTDWVDLYPKKFAGKSISVSVADVEKLLGGEWNQKQVATSLKRAGLNPSKGRTIPIPSWRGDLLETADLVEEVARVTGLDAIPPTFSSLTSPPAARGEGWEKMVRENLAASGFSEAIHFSFLSESDLDRYDPSLKSAAVPLANPLSQEDALLRPTLIPSLLKTASLHHRHKIFDVRLFEFRNTFKKDGNGVREEKSLAAVLSGSRLLSHWSLSKGETDFYDLKGMVERIFSRLKVGNLSFKDSSSPFLHPGQSAEVYLGSEKIGYMGELHPAVGEVFELVRPIFLFEFLWEPIVRQAKRTRHFQNFSRLPVVERDLSIVVKEGAAGGEICDAIRRVDPEQILDVSVFDLYRGAPIPSGEKGLSFSLLLGRRDRTLTEEEITKLFDRVVSTVKTDFGAVIR